MKIGFIIICRYNSRRLPGKILKKINGKEILLYIYERLFTVARNDDIIVATSEEDSDNPIVDFCSQNNINFYRGSLNNVALRFLNCAEKYGFDYATRINGDNIFLDIQTLKEMVSIALKNKYDFISNVKDRTFPKGMSIEIVRTDYYKKVYKEFNKEEFFEHVTLYLYNLANPLNHCYYYNKIEPKAAGIQLALDTKEDFYKVSKIINNFKKDHREYGLPEVYKIYKYIGNESI
jgi:spore coat polysaccharide biosynthesis protein SpsF